MTSNLASGGPFLPEQPRAESQSIPQAVQSHLQPLPQNKAEASQESDSQSQPQQNPQPQSRSQPPTLEPAQKQRLLAHASAQPNEQPQSQPQPQSQSQVQPPPQAPAHMQLLLQSQAPIQPQTKSPAQTEAQARQTPPLRALPQSATPSSHNLSPPSKRDLRSWWKGFKLPSKHQDTHDSRPQGIFGVPLRQSITYANVAISLIDENGKSYIYGYVPIVVAKCGVFLKEKATGVEGIFRLSGSEKRIKELKTIFDSPDRYGKGLVWDGFTVHDAANVLRRYLNDLPEPVVPLDLYEKFREPLRGATMQAVGDADGPQFVENFDLGAAIAKYQSLITELPPLNRQLLLYILDLLAVFAAKADENRMNSQNLAAIFQPGMLSHPAHAMAPEEYRLNQCVIIFLIENQDHFLIGMQGTAADEKTVQEVQKGTPPTTTPVTPSASRKSGIQRSSSNASAGAESVARDGKIRRNRSTSSRHSRHSNGAPSPGSPAIGSAASGGLGRSNTLPSKKSPAIGSGRLLQKADQQAGSVVPLTPATPTPIPPSPTPMEAATPRMEPSRFPQSKSRAAVLGIPLQLSAAQLAPPSRSQEGLLEPTTPDGLTPTRERKLQSLFQRSPTGEGESRQPNKLRKKRLAGSANPSAQSSTASLPHSAAGISPGLELANPLEQQHPLDPPAEEDQAPPGSSSVADVPPETVSAPQQAAIGSAGTVKPSSWEQQHALKPQRSPPHSLHSSFNEGSDLDQVDESNAAIGNIEPDKDRRRRWRLSRRKEDLATAGGGVSSPASAQPPVPTSPRQVLGLNTNAEISTSSIGSGSKQGRRSFSGDPLEAFAPMSAEGQSSHDSNTNTKDSRDEVRGLTGWIKNKYREAKENHDQRRNKSPPADQAPLGTTNLPSSRQKSMDIPRSFEEERTKP